MIPLQLSLRNFLSYRDAILDFRGLHTACICGANGAGKSSLLEAIGWVLWGESRVASEDDIIHMGTKEAQVDFIFQNQHFVYRVIRTRQRSHTTSLEFQVATSPSEATGAIPTAFRSLTERGMRSTQQIILEHLKLDYDTFVNSAYLRQGRADEFMLKRPGERKQILANLLKLDQYDVLEESAKEKSRQFKAQVEVLSHNLEAIQAQLQQREKIADETACLEALLGDLQRQQAIDTETLQTLQQVRQQRNTWEQQAGWQRQHHTKLSQERLRLETEWKTAQQHQQTLEAILHQREAIVAGHHHWQTLQAEEEVQAAKFHAHQTAQTQRQHLQQQFNQQVSELKDQLQRLAAKLEALEQQHQEVQHTLSKAKDVDAALEQLRLARIQLHELDQLQTKVAPLLQRQQQTEKQLDRAQAQLQARLAELRSSAHQLHQQHQQQPQLQQAAIDVAEQIEQLSKKQVYQQRVMEKGLERKSFLERLQAHQREYETQLGELDQKLQLLKQPDASCPVCDRPLDEHHWNVVLTKHQTQHQEYLDLLWVVREQLVVSEREIHVLRQEYRELDRELASLNYALERRGQLQAQLATVTASQETLHHVLAEVDHLEEALATGTYANELHDDLRLLEQSLHQICARDGSPGGYDERDHALARGQVDRWRWAEIKQAEIKQAQQRQAQLSARQPELQSQIQDIQQQLQATERLPLKQQIDELDRHLAHINYNLEQHNALRTALRQAQSWQLRYQELQQAQQHYPQVQQRLEEITRSMHTCTHHLLEATTQLDALVQQLEHTPDPTPIIQTLEQQIQERRSHLDRQLAQLGRLQQQQQHLEGLSSQHTTLSAQYTTAKTQHRVHQELAQAFSKNGIQALMIENVLPQLEAETNQILARLSVNQLHVQFLTQKAGKTAGTKGKSQSNGASTPAKMIDTLDILIADAQGTRPYETYSGGEAFRVNFAIRLALSRLLAQRSGTALQMLIVDEGFGTQDEEGCDRLINAINAIASDFACILTVTHMPHFKEAFQARIEVHKTDQGSQLSLSI